MKIDTHTHIWDTLKFAKGKKRYVPDYLFTQINLEKIMKENNMEKAVLVQPSFLENDNSLLLKTIQLNPNKYKGIIVLNDFDLYSNLESLFNTYNFLGVRGIRLNLIGRDLPDFKEEKYQNLFSLLCKLDWHLEIHANENDICTLFHNFMNKDLKIVLDHFARPIDKNYSSEFIYLLNSGLNFYVKLSANYRFNYYQINNFINVLISTIGKKKLLWGSDCPFTKFEKSWSYKKSIDLLLKNTLTHDLSSILDKNAQNLFKW